MVKHAAVPPVGVHVEKPVLHGHDATPLVQLKVAFGSVQLALHVPPQDVKPMLHTHVQVPVSRCAFGSVQFATQLPPHDVKPVLHLHTEVTSPPVHVKVAFVGQLLAVHVPLQLV